MKTPFRNIKYQNPFLISYESAEQLYIVYYQSLTLYAKFQFMCLDHQSIQVDTVISEFYRFWKWDKIFPRKNNY